MKPNIIHRALFSVYELFIEASNGAPANRTKFVSQATQARTLTIPDNDGVVLLDTTLQTDLIPKPDNTAQALSYNIPGSLGDNGPLDVLTVPAGYAFIFQWMDGAALTNNVGATIQALRNSTAITDAIDCATAGDVWQLSTLDTNEQGLAPGDVLRLVGTNSPATTFRISGYFRAL